MENMENTEKRNYKSKSFQVGRFIIIFFFIVCILLVGAAGGVGGFVLLSNSKSSVMNTVRDRLGLDGDSAVSIPVTQNIRVQESSSIIDASNKVSPAVVSITGTQTVRDFFGNTSDQEVGGGTGMILTSDGLIATNKHVVNGLSGSKMSVVLNDGRVFDAVVKAVDSANDFAVIKIEAKDLPTVELGKSDDLVVGQYVIAVGNALGEYKNSVTLGVVSAKDRRVEASDSGSSSSTEVLTGLIQTDAAINSGNSGGPLVNLAGQVVGINTAIASVSGGSIGIGFAIPIDSLKTVVASVIKTGEIVRPYLGVRYLGINKTIQQMNGLTVDYGAMVSRGNTQAEVAVMPGSPADKAGVVEGDILLEINGERIDEDNTLPKRLQKYNVGDEVSVKLLRKGDEKTIKVKLEKMPS